MSVGVFIVEEGVNCLLEEVVGDFWILGNELMVEIYVLGREFIVLVMDDKLLVVIEIFLMKGYYDYKVKYDEGGF